MTDRSRPRRPGRSGRRSDSSRSLYGVPLNRNSARVVLEKLGDQLSRLGIAFLFAVGVAFVTGFVKKAASVSGGLKYGFWWTANLLAIIIAVVLLILLAVTYFYGLFSSLGGFVKGLQDEFPDRNEFAERHDEESPFHSESEDSDGPDWDSLYGPDH